MAALESHIANKSDWNDGPWKTEPDRRQWLDEDTHYPCLILRNSVGALCGYIGVPPTHPAYGKRHDIVDEDVRIHGGLTFGGDSRSDPVSRWYEVEPGESDDFYWLGFHCAHMGDRCPKLEIHVVAPRATAPVPSTYRDIKYVAEQCRLLAAQLRAMI